MIIKKMSALILAGVLTCDDPSYGICGRNYRRCGRSGGRDPGTERS